MNYIVFDLEWNQSPEGKERSDRYLPFEIVEIGAVKLDQNRKPIGEFRRLVKPQVYEELHFKIQEVTGLEMELLLREGQPFEQVIREFLEWCGPEEYRFCSWGPMDLTELERNIAYYGMEIPFETIYRSCILWSMEMAKAGQLWIRQFASRIWQMREDFIGHSMTPSIRQRFLGK